MIDVFIGFYRAVPNYLQGANKAAPALEGSRCWLHGLHTRISRKKIVGIFELVYKHDLDGWINTIYILVYVGTFDLSKYG